MCGSCNCKSPYFGTYCDLCSGEKVCQLNSCHNRGHNALCISCVADLLNIFLENNVTESELFSEDFIEAAVENGTLPEGSVLVMEDGQLAIILPDSFSGSCSNEVNVSCPELVIINQTLELDYEIQGMVTSFLELD